MKIVSNSSLKGHVMPITAKDTSDWNSYVAHMQTLAVGFTIISVTLGVVCSRITLFVNTTEVEEASEVRTGQRNNEARHAKLTNEYYKALC